MKLIEAIRELSAGMSIPDRLPGIQQGDIPMLAKRAGKEANPLYPVPKLMTRRELEAFCYRFADWRQDR